MAIVPHWFPSWVGWRTASGGEPVARLVAHAAVRAFTWFAAWHIAAAVGTALVTACVVAGVVASLMVNRARRARRRRSRRRARRWAREVPVPAGRDRFRLPPHSTARRSAEARSTRDEGARP